jgi:S-adenosylmethionine:tRNA ribosyltransferase-isomerase
MTTSLAAYDFELPPDRIAQHPVRPRDAARLLHVRLDGLEDRTVRDLPDLLGPNDLLVVNDTRVIPAQLTARRGQARIGITLDQPHPDGTWHALARNARRLRPGDVLTFDAHQGGGMPDPGYADAGGAGEVSGGPTSRSALGPGPTSGTAASGRPPTGGTASGDAATRDTSNSDATNTDSATSDTANSDAANRCTSTSDTATAEQGDANGDTDPLTATVLAREPDGGVTLAFNHHGPAFAAALRQAGALALPPYIDRPTGPQPQDAQDYQTVFARAEGAVAAPTAGLHFTPDLLAALDQRGIRRVTITLHVGAGTFLPVREDDVTSHRMHAERGEITPEAAASVNAARQAGGRIVAVGTTSLRLLESAADPDGRLRPFAGDTTLFILPGYRFRLVDRLMTNFHLPRSTLFMLVCAFAGADRMRAAYAHAIATRYRFYSYGDASLLEREPRE